MIMWKALWWIMIAIVVFIQIGEYSSLDKVFPSYGNQDNDELTSGSDSMSSGGPVSSDFRIVGGVAASAGEFPYHVCFARIESSLVTGQPQAYCICGGVLIHKAYVLTAAHCVYDESGYPLATGDVCVIAGVTNLDGANGETDTEQTLYISEIHVNDAFEVENPFAGGDIAVLRLHNMADITDTVKTIPIATTQPSAAGNCVITGWGTMSGNNSTQSRTLLDAPTPIMPYEACATLYQDVLAPDVLNPDYICIGIPGDGYYPSNACRGDSGGPLSCHGHSGVMSLTGIASWGPEDCVHAPSAYMNVQTQLDFIHDVMGSDFDDIGDNTD